MQCKCNFSEQNLPSRENQTCEGEIPRQTTNPSGDCYSILQTELIENSDPCKKPIKFDNLMKNEDIFVSS